MRKWRRTHYTDQLGPEMDGQEVVLTGWVRDIRDLGKICFMVLKDRRGTVQITAPKKVVGEELYEVISGLGRQYCVAVRGVVRAHPEAPGGFEVIPREVEVLSKARYPLPIDPTGRTPAELDVRLDARVLDLTRDEVRAIFIIQHEVLRAVREFLSKEGFVEVFTPKIIATATEGGAALFPVKYFDKEAYLAQSPQLYKEELTLSFERVFEIAPYFRAEESHTRRHLSEFVMIDVEAAFTDAEDVMEVLERLIRHVFKAVKEHCRKELALLGREDLEVPQVPFERLTYDEALELVRSEGFDVPWGEDFPTPALRALGAKKPGFYFITDWPTASKPFYIKPRDDRPELCEAFDLMHGWLELASGGTRINDKELLIRRLREQGLNPANFEHHLKTFDYGMPPHAGWAIGLARLMMVITGKQNIREVVLFPRDKFRLVP
ncbi:aspartate--tRNA(Asn) ligase [Candidatus Bathyarchaeota archaeon ex4484_135]|nr:MAG: aspartate--tRNA(Asn) ligase [Candidatus Bathyarchaeota archaeon ex4484_135]